VGADDEPMGREMHPDQLTQGTYPPYNRVIHGPPGTDVGSLWIEVNRTPSRSRGAGSWSPRRRGTWTTASAR
jgi:hypothetical protein